MALNPDAWMKINGYGPLGEDADFLLRAMEIVPRAWVKINRSGPLGSNAEFLLRARELSEGDMIF
jgi:hypothetical protein